jgi:hypothetical protein
MRVGCARGFGFGIGIGEPSATRDEPITNRPRWRSSSVEERNGATRTIDVNTPRIRPVSFREYITPPKEQSERWSLSQFLPQFNTALRDSGSGIWMEIR